MSRWHVDLHRLTTARYADEIRPAGSQKPSDHRKVVSRGFGHGNLPFVARAPCWRAHAIFARTDRLLTLSRLAGSAMICAGVPWRTPRPANPPCPRPDVEDRNPPCGLLLRHVRPDHAHCPYRAVFSAYQKAVIARWLQTRSTGSSKHVKHARQPAADSVLARRIRCFRRPDRVACVARERVRVFKATCSKSQDARVSLAGWRGRSRFPGRSSCSGHGVAQSRRFADRHPAPPCRHGAVQSAPPLASPIRTASASPQDVPPQATAGALSGYRSKILLIHALSVSA